MDSNIPQQIHQDIVLLPPKPGDDDEYKSALYVPEPNEIIRSSIKFLRALAPKSSSKLSQEISQRNIDRRIEAVGELDPNRILKCYGYRFGDKPFMIVARSGKQPLSRLVEQGDLGPLERLKLLYETGKAIQYLHSRRPPIVHGGVHPQNILISEPDSAVLSDFGLANLWRLLEEDTSFHQSSGTGQHTVGLAPGAKVGYTAPEYILDDTGEMESPADIYAFASVILAVMSGRHPFTGVTVWSAKGIAAITQGVAPDPKDHPGLPEDDSLWPLLRRMWSQNSEDRPTIDEVMKELGQELQIRGRGSPPMLITLKDSETPPNASTLPHDDFTNGILPGDLVADPNHSAIHGLHADVRRAYWHTTESVRTVAVKYIRCKGDIDRVNRRLKREAKIWMGLRSPFILELYGFRLGKEPCLVSPWCAKGTLLDYLSHHLPSESRILELLVQVASGVEYLHFLKPAIIHGDIKPSNIVIGDSGQALLCDFGLSRLSEGSTGYTSTIGAGVGTIGYRAPELTKPGQQSMEADIYALASVIIHALSGNPPQISVDTARGGGLPQQSDHPALPKGHHLWPLLLQCWNLDAGQRPGIKTITNELKGEQLLRSLDEDEFDLHLTGEHVPNGHATLDVGAANQIPRQKIQTTRLLVPGFFANVYEGTMRQADGTIVPVAIKALRQVNMRSSRSPEAKHERMNKIVGAAKGLAYLHSLDPPICHADIKPGNVLVSDDGKNALLSDFGLSLALTIIRSPNATSGDPQGTRGFQAPEMVFYGKRTLAGDVYAFACLMLDVLTGHFPYYELPRDKATLAMHNQQMPNPSMHPTLPESDPLWILMRKCWATDQTARPRMTNIVKELDRRIDAELHKLSQGMKQLSVDEDDGNETP
ncbi:hypothetical protein FS837_012986 [Tulasnella sp. UAMH 9824]|nr:hypothetical protein FS837_012986 [Tulasnella sp. UAMH 9824]